MRSTPLSVSCLVCCWAATALSQVVSGIRIEGLERTSPEFVRRQLASRVGEPDSDANRRRDFLNLDRLGIFSSIRIESDHQPGGVLLCVKLRETLPLAP